MRAHSRTRRRAADELRPVRQCRGKDRRCPRVPDDQRVISWRVPALNGSCMESQLRGHRVRDIPKDEHAAHRFGTASRPDVRLAKRLRIWVRARYPPQVGNLDARRSLRRASPHHRTPRACEMVALPGGDDESRTREPKDAHQSLDGLHRLALPPSQQAN